MADQNQEQPIMAQTSEEQQQLEQQSLVDPTTTTYLLLHAPCTTTTTTTNTPLCCCFNSNNNNNNSMKQRSPSSSATNASSCAAASEHRASKKLFREHQEDLMTLNVNGLSAMSFVPLCHGSGTFQKPCVMVGIPATPFRSPEHASAAVRGSCCLSPLPRSLIKSFVRDPNNAASPASGDKELILAKEEGSNSMKLRKMKDCMRELRKRCDEVMRDREKEEEEEDLEGAEGDGALSKDDCGGDAEETVNIEWAEKCLSICFKCPCSKGYQILLSGNNCYYKLL